MPMNMELSSNVLMELYDGYFLDFSPILLIILRSMFLVFFLLYSYWCIHDLRVLLATIRYLGSCLCPCCFIKKEYISGLGTKVDDQRCDHLRTDTEQRQSKVEKSRTWIFDSGRGVNSTWVNNLLQEDSWMSTQVGIPLKLVVCLLNWVVIEWLLHKVIQTWIRLLLDVCPWRPPWIWTWRMESDIHSLHADLVCSREQ